MVGGYHTILGTLVPEIRQDLAIDVTRAGLLGVFSWLGFAAAVPAAGFLSDRAGRVRVLSFALVLVGAAALLLATAQRLTAACLWTFLLGGGLGAISSGSSSIMASFFPARSSFMMSVHHAFYAAGTIAGPQVARILLASSGGWRLPYRYGGLLAVALAVLLMPPGRAHAEPIAPPQPQRRPLHKNRTLMLLILLAVLGPSTQNGLFFWLVSYLHEGQALTLAAASMGLSVLSFGLAAGRLLSGWLTLRVRSVTVLTGLFAILVAAIVALTLARSTAAILVLCGAAGLGCSGLFPLLLSLAGRSEPDRPGAAVGLVSTAAGLASAAMPALMSLVVEPTSLAGALLLGAGVAAVGWLVAVSRRARLRVLEEKG